ncbi:MAG: hypothetical protein II464_03825 [Oscillospiraceae bacterium]|nr:hypothetical protein [Oscillospiraceae bacterium]
MSAKPAKSTRPVGSILRYVLIYGLLIAAEAGLGYLGYLFFRTGFLQEWFRFLLIGVDAVFMIGLLWIVNRLTPVG